MSILLAFDPGIDTIGYAAFDVTGLERTVAFQSAGPLLRGSGSFSTSATLPLADRLVSIASEIARLILAPSDWNDRALTVAIERPAMWQTYARNAGAGAEAMAENMAKLYLAIGAITAAASATGARAILQKASRSDKAQRSQLVYAIWPHLSGRKSNEHQRDAISLGLTMLADARRVWAA